MVFVVEYVIIVFRSLKPRGSNPVSSPRLRPDSRLKVLINCWWSLCAAQLTYALLLYSSRIIVIT